MKLEHFLFFIVILFSRAIENVPSNLHNDLSIVKSAFTLYNSTLQLISCNQAQLPDAFCSVVKDNSNLCIRNSVLNYNGHLHSCIYLNKGTTVFESVNVSYHFNNNAFGSLIFLESVNDNAVITDVLFQDLLQYSDNIPILADGSGTIQTKDCSFRNITTSKKEKYNDLKSAISIHERAIFAMEFERCLFERSHNEFSSLLCRMNHQSNHFFGCNGTFIGNDECPTGDVTVDQSVNLKQCTWKDKRIEVQTKSDEGIISMVDCEWENCESDKKNGGGVEFKKAKELHLLGCEFKRCKSKKYGGAVYISNEICNSQINLCVFEKCSSLIGGGLLISEGVKCRLVDCLFLECVADDKGSFNDESKPYLNSGGGVAMIIKDSNSDLLLGSDTLHSLSNENEKLASFSNCLFINNSAASKKGDDVFLVSSSLFNDKSETSRTGRKVHNSINISEKVNFHDCFASNQELYYAVSHIPIDNKHSSVFFMSSVESESLVMENFIKHQNAVKVDPENGQDDAEACIIGGEKPCQTIEYAIEEAGKNNKKKQETPGKTTDTLNSPDISTKQERIIGMRSNESRRNIPLVISLSKADHIVVKKIDICDGIAVLSGNDKSNKTKNPDEQKEQKVTLHLNISKSSASSSLRYSKNYDDFISSDSFFDETLNQSKLQRMTFNRLRKQFEFASQNDERAETEGDSAGPKDSTGKEGSPEGQQQSSHRHQDAAVTVGDGQFKIEFMDIVAEAAKQKHSSGYSARSHANTDEQTKLLISLNPTATNASSTPLLHLLNVSITLSDQLPSTFLLTYPLLSSAGGVLVMDNTSISGFSFQNYPLILFTSDVISSSTPSSSSSSFVSSSIRSTQNPSTSLLYRPFLRINSSTISNIVRHRGDGAAVSALIGKGVKAEIDNTLISDCSVQLGSSGACLFYLEKGASLNIPGSKSEEGKEGNNEEKYGLVVKSCSAQEFGGGVSVVLDDGDEEAPQSDRNDQAESTNEKEDKEIDEKALDNLDEPKVAEDKRITLSLSSLSFSQCSAQKGGNFFVLWTHLPSITPASPSPSFDGSTSAFSLASSSSDQSEAQPYFYLSSSLNSSLSFIQKLNGITSRDLLCLFNPKQQKNWSQADLYALLAPLSVVYVGKAKEGAEKEVKCNETTEEVPCLKVNEAVNELLKMKGKKKVVVVSNDAELLDDKVVIDCATVEGKDEMKELKIVEKKITENEDPTIGSFLFDCKNDANFTSLKIALNEKVQKREAFFGCIHGCLTLIRVQLLHPFVQKVNSASLNAHSSALVYEPLSFMKAIELHFGFLQVDGCSFSFPSCSNSIGSTLCAISSHISINSTVFTSPSSPPSSSSSSSFSSSSIIMPSLPFSSSFSSVSLPLSSQSAPSHTFVCATDSFSWNSSQLFLNNSVTHISNTAIKGNANGAIFISSGSLALTNASFTENNPLLDKYPSFRRNLMCENGAVDMKSAGEGDGKKSDDCLWFMSDNCKMKGVLEQKDSFFFIPQLLNVEMELLKEEEKSDDKKTRKQKVPLLHLLSAQNDEKEKEKEEKEKEKPKEQNAIVKLIGKNFIPCNAILEIIIGYESTQTKSLWKINVQNETYATTVIPISAIQVPKTQRNSFPSSLSAPSSSLFYSLNSSEDLSSSSSTNSASGKSISSNGASISVHMLFWVDEMSKKRTRTYTMKNGKYFIAPSTEDDDADDLSYTSVLWYVTFVAMCAFSVAAVLWRFKLKRDEKNRGQNSEREANFSSLEEAHAKLSLRKD